jgi:hypothetical protein
VNHWFNLVDLRGILRSCQAICPYPDLQLRWLYPQTPQKLSQSLYKTILEAVDYNLWISEIIPNFAAYTERWHCISEHPEESRFLGHLATGSLERIVENPIMLDRFQRGPLFRETPDGDLASAVLALRTVLDDLVEQHPKVHAHVWADNIKAAFQQAAAGLQQKAERGELDLHSLLFPARGSMESEKKDLDSFLQRYVILPSDKCRGNYFVVCKNLYIRQCVHALHNSPQYELSNLTEQSIVGSLLQDLSGLLHHSHFALIAETTPELSYFYELPKPHKTPLGWRPVAASHRSVTAVAQRILTQVLGLVLNTLKDFNAREFAETDIRKFWIAENSLEVVLSLPAVLADMFSSDIDSMYQNMDQDCVIEATSAELRRAAGIVGADAFFVVIHNTIYGNPADQAFWHSTQNGLNPVDHSISALKDGCRKGVLYNIDRVLQLMTYIVKNTYVTLGNSTHLQKNGLPQGGHSSGHMANLRRHHYERLWVERFPWHSLQYAISRFMDDFGVANAAYFKHMYQDIYPPETGIRLIPNQVVSKPGRLVECKLLDTLIFVDEQGVVHVTLYDKRDDYNFFVNRFPDIDSNVSRGQSISTFYGEIVRLIGEIWCTRTQTPTLHKTRFHKPACAAGLPTYKPGALLCGLKCRAAVRAADRHHGCERAAP